LTPDYQPGCKRLVMSNDYYRSMQRANVFLCTERISHISEKAMHTLDGTSHEVDLLVLATGFDPRAYMRPMELVNEKGVSLSAVWQTQGIQAYRTVALPDFGNFFMVLGPNSPVGNFSVISAAEDQTAYIIKCINKKLDLGCDSIAPAKEACESYNKAIKEAMQSTIWLTGCKSWYLDEQGNSATWPWTPKKFREVLRKVNFDDFIFK
jgi:cation diffusion facilitator CzcD-associated flavoprotein CzcO